VKPGTIVVALAECSRTAQRAPYISNQFRHTRESLARSWTGGAGWGIVLVHGNAAGGR